MDNASSRIKLFRIAFGAAAPGQIVPQAEIRALTTAPGGTRAPVIDWQPVGDVPRDAAKLALLALMCLETAMPWGGAVSVRHDAARWIVTGRAERLNIDAALWRGLGDAAVAAPVTAAQVQFRLLPAEVAAQGRVLTVTVTETTLEIRF